MTGAFGPTINLATSEFLPVGRMRANRRGCMTRPFFRKDPTDRFADDLRIPFNLSFSKCITPWSSRTRLNKRGRSRHAAEASARQSISRRECLGRTGYNLRVCSAKRSHSVRYRTQGRLRNNFILEVWWLITNWNELVAVVGEPAH
jgi:hypothetical protein